MNDILIGALVGIVSGLVIIYVKNLITKINDIHRVIMGEDIGSQPKAVNIEQCKSCKLALDYAKKLMVNKGGGMTDMPEDKPVMGFGAR